MIDRGDWRWKGMPGHLIVSTSCCFHMVTHIGDCRVSTIGCYHQTMPDGKKNYANRYPIGAGEDSLYETLVFPLDGDEIADWAEIDGERYATEEAAEAGHMRFCEKVAAVDGDPARVREEAWA